MPSRWSLRVVADKTGKRLPEYFDYIAGTSRGAIIAAGIARGMTIAQLVDFYRASGKQMFEHAWLIQRVKYFYTADPLKASGLRRWATAEGRIQYDGAFPDRLIVEFDPK